MIQKKWITGLFLWGVFLVSVMAYAEDGKKDPPFCISENQCPNQGDYRHTCYDCSVIEEKGVETLVCTCIKKVPMRTKMKSVGTCRNIRNVNGHLFCSEHGFSKHHSGKNPPLHGHDEGVPILPHTIKVEP